MPDACFCKGEKVDIKGLDQLKPMILMITPITFVNTFYPKGKAVTSCSLFKKTGPSTNTFDPESCIDVNVQYAPFTLAKASECADINTFAGLSVWGK